MPEVSLRGQGEADLPWRVPAVGLREARGRRNSTRKQLAAGIDPSAARKAEKAVAPTRQEMSYMETRRALGAVAFFMGYLATFPLHATFHIVQIQEVMAGANGNPAIQFVELTMLGPNENCQQSGDIDPEGPFGCVDGSGFPDFSAARLFFFNAAG